MKKNNFDVFGMTCSSCQAHVEKAVRKLDGVNKASVNLLSNDMSVEFDETKVTEDIIIKAVIDAGYNAKIKEKVVTNVVDDKLKSMKKRLIISICFLIPLMYIAMHQMINHMFGIAAPRFIRNIFSGVSNSLNFAIAQIVLLAPIVIVNRNYFSVGFKRLFKRSPNMDSLIALGSSASIIYGFIALGMMIYGFSINDLQLVSRYCQDLYFESAGTILTLITLGKFLETKSKGRTSEAISKLINLAPKTAIVLKDGKEVEVEFENIKEKDILLIRPGESIPVDGVIVDGITSVDQSSITGESIPVNISKKTYLSSCIICCSFNSNIALKVCPPSILP